MKKGKIKQGAKEIDARKKNLSVGQLKKSSLTNSFLNKADRFYFVFILLLIAIVYSQVINFTYTGFDDDFLVVNNMQKLMNAKFTDVFAGNSFLTDAVSGFYRPLQTVSFIVDAQIGGGGLWMFHLTNILLFSLSSLLLFKLLRKFEFDIVLSLIATLIFSLHPLFSINVSWLPARGDLLIVVFGLASFLYFLSYIETKNILNLIIHFFLLLLAFLSKETAVLLPIIMIIYYVLFKKKYLSSEFIKLLILWFLGFSFWVYLRFSFSGSLPQNQIFGLIPFIENLRTIPEYISKLILPINLMSMPVFSIFTTLIGVVAIAFFIILILRMKKEEWKKEKGEGRRDLRLIVFGVLWFLILVLPGMLYSRYYPKSEMFYHYLDHRAFLPMIGVIIILMLLIEPYLRKINSKKIFVYGLGITICLSIYSFNQVQTFKEPLRFLTDAIVDNPKASVAYFLRGNYWKNSGVLNKAINDYSSSVTIDKNYAEAYNNRGSAYGLTGDYLMSIKDLTKAIKLEPDIPDGYFNRAIARDATDDYAGAVRDFTKSISITPKDYLNYYLRGNAYNSLGEKGKAINDYSRAIQLNSKLPDAFLNRANLLYQTGNPGDACTDWKRAAELGSQPAKQMLEKYCGGR